MTRAKRWRDTDHLQRAVDTAGGPDAFNAAVGEMLDQALGWRLAELRTRREIADFGDEQPKVASPPHRTQCARGVLGCHETVQHQTASTGTKVAPCPDRMVSSDMRRY